MAAGRAVVYYMYVLSIVGFYMLQPVTVWITGLSGAGKSTLAKEIHAMLSLEQIPCMVIDGDEIRSGLCSDLGFHPADRKENIRRAAEIARLANASGISAVVALMSPRREDRRMARYIVGERFIEVFAKAPFEVCAARDRKGLYALAKAGELKNFVGLDILYEEPVPADLVVDTVACSIHVGAMAVTKTMLERLFK